MSRSPALSRPHKGFRGISSGAKAFVAGLKLVVPGGDLFKYAVLPVGLSLLVLAGVLVGSFFAAHHLLGNWLESTWLTWLGSLLAVLVGLVIAYFIFVPVLNVLAPWFIDPITHEVFRRATGRDITDGAARRGFVGRQAMALLQFLVGVLVAVFIQLPLAIAGLFTGVTGMIAIAINATIMGAELMEHPVGASGGRLRDRVAWVRGNFWPAVGLGGAASLCVVIPVLNLFVLPAGVAGATLLYTATLPDSGEQPQGSAVILDNR